MVNLQPYRVSAYNLAKNSENKIHDDTVARRLGFQGGLVPGVEVLAYMSHIPVAKWGQAFLERGVIDARFVKPVYDGEDAVITAQDDDGGLAIEVESRGEICAEGQARLSAASPQLTLDDFLDVAVIETRAPVDGNSYPTGRWFGVKPFTPGQDAALKYLADVRETDPLYADRKIVHPGMLLRMMNWVLIENAILGPWIHVGSSIQHLNLAAVDDELTVRALVTGNYERKGHKFVELDGVIVANGARPIARCRHVAIYQPRKSVPA